MRGTQKPLDKYLLAGWLEYGWMGKWVGGWMDRCMDGGWMEDG